MLAFGKLTLQQLDGLFREGGKYCEGAGQPALAKAAVADRAYGRFSMNLIAYGPTCAAARVNFGHWGLQT